MRRWEQRVLDNLFEPEAISLIEGANELISRFGEWPGFEDAEVLSLEFDRGNHMEVVGTERWENREPEYIRVDFLTIHPEYPHKSTHKNRSVITLVYRDLIDVTINGLKYQNPISGLGIQLEYSESRRTKCFRVDWGGTALGHEVSLLCANIKVETIDPC